MRALAAVVALTLLACQEPPHRSPAPPKRAAAPALVFSPPAGFSTLRVGLVPYLAPETMRATHARLFEYLSKQLSVPVEIVVGDSYGDAVERLERGEFELVELSPYAYAQAAAKVKLRCLVQTIADGSASAAGYIFVRDDSPRRTLEDLKGAKVGFVDRSSTSGYLYPMKLLKDRGLSPTSFGGVEFLGNHEAVLLAVLEGRVDVGATYQGAFAALRRSRGVDPLSFRVIAKTPRTPRDIYCVRPEVPNEVAEAITRSLLALSARDRVGREILNPLAVNGFQPADDRMYDEVRRVAAELAGQ